MAYIISKPFKTHLKQLIRPNANLTPFQFSTHIDCFAAISLGAKLLLARGSVAWKRRLPLPNRNILIRISLATGKKEKDEQYITALAELVTWKYIQMIGAESDIFNLTSEKRIPGTSA